MSINNLKKLGFALSNAGLLDETENEVRKENPNWNDKKIKEERNERLREKTLSGNHNKKPKKAKK